MRVLHQDWLDSFNEPKLKDWQRLSRDPSERGQRTALLLELGFKIAEDTIVPPTPQEFSQNYIDMLKRKNIPIEKAILPAIVYVERNLREQEFYFQNPTLDDHPGANWDTLSAETFFHIPYTTMIREIRRGRFPILDVHDFFHLVSFLLHPEYMIALRESLSEVEPTERIHPLINYVVEILALADPKKIEFIRRVLPVRVSNPNATFEEIKTAVDKLSVATLLGRAKTLERAYSSLIIEYGGAAARPAEKMLQNVWTGGNHVFDLFTKQPRERSLEFVWRESFSYYGYILDDLLPIMDLSSHELAQYMTREIQPWKYPQLFLPGQNLRGLLPRGGSFELRYDVHKQILAMVRLHVARMTYALWRTANDMTVERIVHGLIRPDGTVDPEVAEFFKLSVGEESLMYQAIEDLGP